MEVNSPSELPALEDGEPEQRQPEAVVGHEREVQADGPEAPPWLVKIRDEAKARSANREADARKDPSQQTPPLPGKKGKGKPGKPGKGGRGKGKNKKGPEGKGKTKDR